MCDTDFDPPQIFTLRAPRARKPHRCEECRTTIQPGETYARCAGLTDGNWWGGVRCAGCYFLAETIQELECGGEGQILWGGGQLDEEIREMDQGDYDEEADEFAPNWARVAFDALCARAEATP